MVIFLHSKEKRLFWNFWGQNHKISKIRDSHLAELVILRLTCVLYAFPFNSLSFMYSQTKATFGSEIACSDVTNTSTAQQYSVWCFWNTFRRWSIQFVTATQSLERLRRAKPELSSSTSCLLSTLHGKDGMSGHGSHIILGEITRRKSGGKAFNAPPPPPQQVAG